MVGSCSVRLVDSVSTDVWLSAGYSDKRRMRLVKKMEMSVLDNRIELDGDGITTQRSECGNQANGPVRYEDEGNRYRSQRGGWRQGGEKDDSLGRPTDRPRRYMALYPKGAWVAIRPLFPRESARGIRSFAAPHFRPATSPREHYVYEEWYYSITSSNLVIQYPSSAQANSFFRRWWLFIPH